MNRFHLFDGVAQRVVWNEDLVWAGHANVGVFQDCRACFRAGGVALPPVENAHAMVTVAEHVDHWCACVYVWRGRVREGERKRERERERERESERE